MDKKYTNGQGDTVKVLSIEATGFYPVVTLTNGNCETYTLAGVAYRRSKTPQEDLIEVGEYIPKPNEVIAVWDYEDIEPFFDKFLRFGTGEKFSVYCAGDQYAYYRALTDEERGIDQ